MGKVIVANGYEEDEPELNNESLVHAGGRTVIRQELLREYISKMEEVEKLHSLIKQALSAGAVIEDGDIDAGLFREYRKAVNWRDEFIKLGGDPEDVLDIAKRQPFLMVRVFKKGEKVKGERVDLSKMPLDGEALEDVA